VNFFLTIHRSVVEPSFYKEIQEYSGCRIWFYLVQLLLVTSIICALAQSYYLMDSQRGIAPKVESVLKGMEIKNGQLDPGIPTPVVPATYLVVPVLDQLSGFQNFFPSDNDSMIIIDTAKTRNYVKIPVILMSSDKFILMLNKTQSLEIPYKVFFLGLENFKFTSAEITRFLMSHRIAIFFSMFIACVFQNAITLAFSIFFLAVAAFFFRMEKGNTFARFIRASSFAITPMAIGMMLIALSGVKILWGWHVLIFISTIVIFRGLVASGNPAPLDDSGENKL
jgi:hypothetical protein